MFICRNGYEYLGNKGNVGELLMDLSVIIWIPIHILLIKVVVRIATAIIG